MPPFFIGKDLDAPALLRFRAASARLHNQMAGPWRDFVDFQDAARRTKMFGVLGAIYDPNLPDGGMRAVLVEEFVGCLWERYGCNVFRLSPHLAAALVLTTPAPFDPASFKLPFPAFFICLPPGVVPFWREDGRQEWADILTVATWDAPNRWGEAVPMVYYSASSRGCNLWNFSALVDFTKPIPELVEERGVRTIEASAVLSEKPMPEDFVTLRAVGHILRNVVSWVHTCGGGKREVLPHPVLTKKAAAKLPPQVEPTVWGLGREVRLRPELLRVAAEQVLGRSRASVVGWRLRTRFVVRGHFWPRDPEQAPKRGKRRWVDPYWKGPEGAEAWSHVYTDAHDDAATPADKPPTAV